MSWRQCQVCAVEYFQKFNYAPGKMLDMTTRSEVQNPSPTNTACVSRARQRGTHLCFRSAKQEIPHPQIAWFVFHLHRFDEHLFPLKDLNTFCKRFSILVSPWALGYWHCGVPAHPHFPRPSGKLRQSKKAYPKPYLALFRTARRAHEQAQSLLHLTSNKEKARRLEQLSEIPFSYHRRAGTCLQILKENRKKSSLGMQFWRLYRSGQHCWTQKTPKL